MVQLQPTVATASRTLLGVPKGPDARGTARLLLTLAHLLPPPTSTIASAIIPPSPTYGQYHQKEFTESAD